MNKLYNILPIPCQNILISLYGFILKKQRFNRTYKKKLTNFKSTDLSQIDYEKKQLEELNKLLLYSKKNSLYYKKRLKKVKLPLNNLKELSSVPVLTKDDVRENINNIVTQSKRTMLESKTGGTTGKSLSVYYTKSDFQERMAYLDYFKWQHGVEQGMRRASFTGKRIVPLNQQKPPYWRYNSSIKQMLFSSFHANSNKLYYYIKALNEFKPESLDGYPSIMVKIAEYSIKNNIPITFRPKAIFPTAETLLDDDKEMLEKVFKTKVRNQYASSEGAPFITECKKGSLHLNIETGVFEKVEEEEVSEILVTSFTTYGTPLIRYKIGDSLEFTDKTCTCNIKTPLVKRILGRSSEFLYDVYNNSIVNSPTLISVTRLVENIERVQYTQESLSEVKVSVILIDKSKEEITKKQLKYNLRKVISDSITLNIVIANELRVDSSGKTRFIINDLSKDEL